jgi:hypothetical protein
MTQFFGAVLEVGQQAMVGEIHGGGLYRMLQMR